MGELEKTVGYTFQDPKLLELALTHSSYAHEHYAGKRHDNERLEFLGDAVLELVSSDYLFHNYNEYPEGELTKLRASITSDAMEALIGAIYLDGGFANAKEFITRFVLNDLENKKLFYDSKTILQEIVQRDFNEPLSYELLAEEGPDHDKKFRMQAKIGEKAYGVGVGHTKKGAQQLAAYETILLLKKTNA